MGIPILKFYNSVKEIIKDVLRHTDTKKSIAFFIS